MNDNIHSLTDQVLRQQLTELPPPVPAPGDWERLERRLDQAADQAIRSALNGLAPTPPAAGWAALASRLDARSPADQQIAEALNALQPAVAAGSWDQLSQRLDAANEEAVDAIVSGHLGGTSAAPATGWAALAARLELIGHRRELIAAWKITEGALMASFLLLLLRFFPLPAVDSVPAVAGNFPVDVPVNTVNVETAKRSPVYSLEDRHTATPTTASQSTKSKISPQPSVTAIPTATLPEPLVKSAIPPPATRLLTTPLALVDQLPIEPLRKRILPPSPALHLPVLRKAEPVIYYGNAYVSLLDVNHITTPQSRVAQVDIQQRNFAQAGASAGFMLDAAQGKHALQIGLIYSYVGYTPTNLDFIHSNVAVNRDSLRGFDQFEYQAIEVPLSYKRTISENKKWRFGLRVGMSLRVVAVANYSGLDDVKAALDYSSRVQAVNAAPVPGRPASISAFTNGKSALENPVPGWLQGGSMLVNSSFYISGGLVIERLLTPRWSLYASPSVSKVIYLDPAMGIGPYKDRINIGSLRIGGRYRFGKQ